MPLRRIAANHRTRQVRKRRQGEDLRPFGFAGPVLESNVIGSTRPTGSPASRSTKPADEDRVKFRVKRMVYLAFSRDETLTGFGFPKEQRQALVESEPHKFLLPPMADMRYTWVDVRVAHLDIDEMTELVTDAWTMVVPKYIPREYFDALGTLRGIGQR